MGHKVDVLLYAMINLDTFEDTYLEQQSDFNWQRA